MGNYGPYSGNTQDPGVAWETSPIGSLKPHGRQGRGARPEINEDTAFTSYDCEFSETFLEDLRASGESIGELWSFGAFVVS
jgi:hypothetical protein